MRTVESHFSHLFNGATDFCPQPSKQPSLIWILLGKDVAMKTPECVQGPGWQQPHGPKSGGQESGASPAAFSLPFFFIFLWCWGWNSAHEASALPLSHTPVPVGDAVVTAGPVTP